MEALLQFVYLSPVGIVKFSANGTIDLLNPVAAQLLLPLLPDGDLGNLYEALAPVVPDLQQMVSAYIDDAGVILDQQRFESSAGGKPLVLTLTVNRVNDAVYMAVLADITKLAEQEKKLFVDQQWFRAIFAHVRDYAIYTVTLDGLIDEWNQSLFRFGGWEREDVEGAHIGMFFPTGEAGSVDVRALLAEARRVGSVETEGWRLKRDGSRLWGNTVITAIPDEIGAARAFVVVARDMTARKRLEDELAHFASVDPLTGAFNRRLGLVRLTAELERWERVRQPVSVLMLDIDHFKKLNDEFGHAAGDAVLRAVVDTCKDGIRAIDTLARWGGEEFVILLPETGQAAAVATAERLRIAVASLQVPFMTCGMLSCTVSIGAADVQNADPSDVLRRADQALYAAKSGGRNQVVYASAVVGSSIASSSVAVR